ncbi:DUF1127 domain-containing protein [Ciceribacter ferrooxidans]|uniref:DUF1127 domain-containing protein n=1 Tax=Ciceribacter ferrooxidans TaxID=2509717 RepID=UPI0026C8C8F3
MDNHDPGRTRPRWNVLDLPSAGHGTSAEMTMNRGATDRPAGGATHAASWLGGVATFFRRMRERRRNRNALHGLSDQTLKDIGVSRGQFDGDFERYRRRQSYGLERLTRL